ncbi:hypothetical protein ACIQNI_30530 [Streptomyces sp. NPDC091266]|uniref:hypothetical protein n=1 Tax=Streptomyces sp. NPDC091266 TaxID=3365978 RepID=UPI003818BA49
MLDEHTGPAVQQPEQLGAVLRRRPVQQIPLRQLLSRPAAPYVRLRHQYFAG